MNLPILPRQYYPIWDKLKRLPAPEAKTKGVSITAPRVLHKRIVKAVIKEKWMDLPFKLGLEPTVAILIPSRNNSIITFRLIYQLRHVSMKDL